MHIDHEFTCGLKIQIFALFALLQVLVTKSKPLLKGGLFLPFLGQIFTEEFLHDIQMHSAESSPDGYDEGDVNDD